MKTPIIGISGSIMKDSGGMFPGYGRAYVNDDYVQAVFRAGAIPIILPIMQDEEKIKELIGKIDGLILSGGHDVNPLLYSEEPDIKTTEIFPERDTFDFALIKYAKLEKKPILGICRGMQILNTYHGGSNYQDNSYCETAYIKHWQGHTPNLATHTALVESGSRLEDILGTEILVNSFHHQSLKKIGNGFKIAAKAKDGIIEAIESDNEHWCLGLQFHPEMMAATEQKMQEIFNLFVNQVK